MIMDILSQKTAGAPIEFICENFQIWKEGRCTDRGYFDGTVTITGYDGNQFSINFDKPSHPDMVLPENYTVDGKQDGNVMLSDKDGMVCTIISYRDEISCLRFTLYDNSIIEYYGKVHSFSLNAAPKKGTIKFVSKKNEYKPEIIRDLRDMCRNKTYVPAPIDCQIEIVAFASKKFMEFYDENCHLVDSDTVIESMRNQIFKDTWSLFYSEIIPGVTGLFLDGVVSDAKEWYDILTVKPGINVRQFLSEYYSYLKSGGDKSVMLLFSKYIR